MQNISHTSRKFFVAIPKKKNEKKKPYFFSFFFKKKIKIKRKKFFFSQVLIQSRHMGRDREIILPHIVSNKVGGKGGGGVVYKLSLAFWAAGGKVSK